MKDKTTICNLCGAVHFNVVEDSEKPFYVLKCIRCGLVFVDPVPEPSFLEAHYDADYYADWMGPQQEKRLRMWRKRLDTIEKRSPKGRLLDVGCATGTFLQLAQKNGWEVEGTELSPYAVSFAKNLLNANIFCGHLMDAGYEEASFDVVTFWHVLEHLSDPMRYLQEAHRILKPSGLLVIAAPNVNDYIMKISYRIVKRRPLKLFFRTDREIHLFHFSADTLRLYLNKTGFRCTGIFPDNGITEPSKRVVHAVGVALYHVTGLRFFNALEVHAIRV
ncbi:MAG: class I SAM-dependent methyltransferase [Deltaproteobacteria bacterium]|nr:class I SAM-dependent methyltransferase [Deltaproteobacteria bacterium]